GYLYPGYYLPKDRAERIDNLLLPKNDWTKSDVEQMINDNTSSRSSSVVKSFISSIKSDNNQTKKAVEILSKWNGSNNETDIAPTIYNKFIYHYLKNTFEDELGKKDFDALL